jgi:iron complex outermembrane recepter protein
VDYKGDIAVHSTFRRSVLLASTTALASLLRPDAALASGADAAPADSGAVPGEIIVTASHRAESLQKVPISIQALSAAALTSQDVKGLSDLTKFLPSVSFAGLGPGRQTPYFRGIVPAGGTYDSVGYYLDDIPLVSLTTGPGGSSGLPDVHIYDVERVEGLSGPQGTLYGAGSLAGTIRVIAKKPVLGKYEAGLEAETNKYGDGAYGGQIQGYVNIPIAKTLAVRAMAFYQHDGGYIDNTYGKLNLSLGDSNPNTNYSLNNAALVKKNYNPVYSYGGRFTALWEAAPGWTITPSITAQREIADGYFNYDANPTVEADHQNAGGDLIVHDYSPTREDDRWYQASLAIRGHIGDWDLVSATGYYHRKTHVQNDYTYYSVSYDVKPGYENYLQFFDKNGNLINPIQTADTYENQTKFNQEVRLTTPKTWPFDVTIGGFYQEVHTHTEFNYPIAGLANVAGYTEAGAYSSGDQAGAPAGFGVPIADGGTMVTGSPAIIGDDFYYVNRDAWQHDEAVFAEGHYNITPELKLTGGIRYFWTDSETRGFNGNVLTPAGAYDTVTGQTGCSSILTNGTLTCLTTNPLSPDHTLHYRESGETHKVALNYQIDPSKMIYLNYSTGFRPGGPNSPLRVKDVGLVQAPAYKSEKLTNYEFGFKTVWDNILRLNAAFYYETWDGVQYSIQVEGTGGSGITGNAGNARVYGAEYDGELKLGKVTISTSGAYADAALSTNFCPFVLNASALTITQPACAPADAAALKGTRLPRQPRFKGNTTLRYDTSLGQGYAGYLQGTVYYQTGATQNLSTYLDSLIGDTPGFETFDFSGGVKKGNWGVELFIQNAFDRRGILTRNAFCGIVICHDSARSYPIKPQFFGLRFSRTFG